MITGRYNHSVTGVSSIRSVNESVGINIRKASSGLIDEIHGAMIRYYDLPIDDIYDLISDGKINISSRMGGYEHVVDVESGNVICAFRVTCLSNKSNMDWSGYPVFNTVIEFKFQAFDNKLNRDTIKPHHKTKGKRK